MADEAREKASVTVTWTLQYDPDEIRAELLYDTGKAPSISEIEDRIRELATNEFLNCGEHHFQYEHITLDWEGDTIEWEDSNS